MDVEKQSEFIFELLQRKQFAHAERMIVDLLESIGEQSWLLASLAICRVSNGQNHESVELAKNAVQLDPEDEFSLFVLAQCQSTVDPVIALKTIDSVIAMNPLRADYYTVKSSILLRLKKPREALTAAEKGLELDPNSVQAHEHKIASLINLKKNDQLRPAAAELLRLNPNSVVGLTTAKIIDNQKADIDSTIKELNSILEIDPNQRGLAKLSSVLELSKQNELTAIPISLRTMGRKLGIFRYPIALAGFLIFFTILPPFFLAWSVQPIRFIPLIVLHLFLMYWFADGWLVFLILFDRKTRSDLSRSSLIRSLALVGFSFVSLAVATPLFQSTFSEVLYSNHDWPFAIAALAVLALPIQYKLITATFKK